MCRARVKVWGQVEEENVLSSAPQHRSRAGACTSNAGRTSSPQVLLRLGRTDLEMEQSQAKRNFKKNPRPTACLVVVKYGMPGKWRHGIGFFYPQSSWSLAKTALGERGNVDSGMLS